jgi:hypothetical protein
VKNRETHKDITVGDRPYRLTKMDPRLGCFLFTTLSSKADDNKQLMSSLGHCTKDEFDEIQSLALRFVFYTDKSGGEEFHIPVIGANGMWADKNLQDDPSELLQVTIQSLLFNLKPFLVESELTAPLSGN